MQRRRTVCSGAVGGRAGAIVTLGFLSTCQKRVCAMTAALTKRAPPKRDKMSLSTLPTSLPRVSTASNERQPENDSTRTPLSHMGRSLPGARVYEVAEYSSLIMSNDAGFKTHHAFTKGRVFASSRPARVFAKRHCHCITNNCVVDTAYLSRTHRCSSYKSSGEEARPTELQCSGQPAASRRATPSATAGS